MVRVAPACIDPLVLLPAKQGRSVVPQRMAVLGHDSYLSVQVRRTNGVRHKKKDLGLTLASQANDERPTFRGGRRRGGVLSGKDPSLDLIRRKHGPRRALR